MIRQTNINGINDFVKGLNDEQINKAVEVLIEGWENQELTLVFNGKMELVENDNLLPNHEVVSEEEILAFNLQYKKLFIIECMKTFANFLDEALMDYFED